MVKEANTPTIVVDVSETRPGVYSLVLKHEDGLPITDKVPLFVDSGDEVTVVNSLSSKGQGEDSVLVLVFFPKGADMHLHPVDPPKPNLALAHFNTPPTQAVMLRFTGAWPTFNIVEAGPAHGAWHFAAMYWDPNTDVLGSVDPVMQVGNPPGALP